MKQVWRTLDGEIFESHVIAAEHEKGLFKAWLDARPKIDIKLLVDCADSSTEDSWHGSEKDFHLMTARAAFAAEKAIEC